MPVPRASRFGGTVADFTEDKSARFKIGKKGDEDLCWSNENGWVDMDYATVFNLKEKETLDLPMGGYWFQIPDAKEGDDDED